MYNYDTEKANLFTDDGQRLFLKIRDKVKAALANSGSIQMGSAISGFTGSSWLMLACVDRMVELGELREIKQQDVAGQHRIFIAP